MRIRLTGLFEWKNMYALVSPNTQIPPPPSVHTRFFGNAGKRRDGSCVHGALDFVEFYLFRLFYNVSQTFFTVFAQSCIISQNFSHVSQIHKQRSCPKSEARSPPPFTMYREQQNRPHVHPTTSLTSHVYPFTQ